MFSMERNSQVFGNKRQAHITKLRAILPAHSSFWLWALGESHCHGHSLGGKDDRMQTLQTSPWRNHHQLHKKPVKSLYLTQKKEGALNCYSWLSDGGEPSPRRGLLCQVRWSPAIVGRHCSHTKGLETLPTKITSALWASLFLWKPVLVSPLRRQPGTLPLGAQNRGS